jgi:hypothetical protein
VGELDSSPGSKTVTVFHQQGLPDHDISKLDNTLDFLRSKLSILETSTWSSEENVHLLRSQDLLKIYFFTGKLLVNYGII